MKFGMMHSDLLDTSGQKQANFKNPRWRTATILKMKIRYLPF